MEYDSEWEENNLQMMCMKLFSEFPERTIIPEQSSLKHVKFVYQAYYDKKV